MNRVSQVCKSLISINDALEKTRTIIQLMTENGDLELITDLNMDEMFARYIEEYDRVHPDD